MNLLLRTLIWCLSLVGLAVVATPYLGFLSGTIDAIASLLPIGFVAALLAILLAALARRIDAPIMLAFLAMLLGAARMIPEWLPESPPASAIPGEGVRIVVETHNMASGGTERDRQIRALATSGADILLLQEQRKRGARVTDALDGIYPYRDSCRRCELAILSRWPMSQVRWRLRDRDGNPAGPPLFRADVTVPGGGVMQVMTVHQPWPIPPERQAQARASLIAAIHQTPSDRILLAGDFNLTPWGSAMRQLDAGLQPMVRITRGRFSFPARIGRLAWPFPFLPIDHVFVGQAFTVRTVETMPPTGSDHLPIRVTLHLSPDSRNAASPLISSR